MKDINASLHGGGVTGLRTGIVWMKPPAPGISLATFTDNASIDEAALLGSLSQQERTRAVSITDTVEKRHYVFRRCFQRVFVQNVLNWRGEINALEIMHRVDTQPKCLDAPSLNFSFSSSGTTAVACASSRHSVGVDIENIRQIENAATLAQRFFTPEEAASITTMPIIDQNIAFLKHWTAKEAGLKAIGKGIVSGLNSFTLTPQGERYHIDTIAEYKRVTAWHLHHVMLSGSSVVAVVHNLEK